MFIVKSVPGSRAVALNLLVSAVPGSISKFVIAHLVLSLRVKLVNKSFPAIVNELLPCETWMTLVACAGVKVWPAHFVTFTVIKP